MYYDRPSFVGLSTLSVWDSVDTIKVTLEELKPDVDSKYRALVSAIQQWMAILATGSGVISGIVTVLTFWKKEPVYADLAASLRDYEVQIGNQYRAWIDAYLVAKTLNPKDADQFGQLRSFIVAGQKFVNEMDFMASKWTISKTDIILAISGGWFVTSAKRIVQITWSALRPAAGAVAGAAGTAASAVGSAAGVVIDYAARPVGQVLWLVRNIVPIAIIGAGAYFILPTVIGKAWLSPKAKS